MPWKTPTPASSRSRAQRMLEASSKRGHELDDDGDVLALGGFAEGAEHGGIGAGAVEGLLNGDDGGVFGGGLDEALDGLVAVEGVMEKDVMLAELVEDVCGFFIESELAAFEEGVLEGGEIDGAVEVHEAGEVDGAVGP